MLRKDISRRDFLNGALLMAGASILPRSSLGNTIDVLPNSNGYPPLLSGMRGSNDASFKYAHALAMGGEREFGDVKLDNDAYDLVVVGAGISGLAAAHFYRQTAGEDKRILILENHDDFGGHARRNEFLINGKTYMSYGGSQSIDEPSEWSRVACRLLKDLAMDLRSFDDYYDRDFYSRHGLSSVTYFNKKTFGKDVLVNYTLYDFSDFLVGIKKPALGYEDAVDQMPLSEKGKSQLKAIIAGNPSTLLGRDGKGAAGYLRKTPYPQFLKEQYGADHQQALHMLRLLTTDNWGMGSDVLSALEAIASGAPGINRAALRKLLGSRADRLFDAGEPYIHHSPDGLASLTRLLVRKLIPAVASGNNAEDVIMSRFNYDRLDSPDSPVRLRLNSTVVEARHNGDVKTAPTVAVTYVNNGQAHKVTAKHCIMACYNRIIPYLAPGLPSKQKKALSQQVKTAQVYTTVMLNNWHALKKLGIAAASCPGNMHNLVIADFPVSMGQRQFPSSPTEPMAITMISTPLSEKPGLPPREQFREGRYELMATTYSEFEDEIVSHLNGMLGPAGFDAEKDIDAITVNRWPHGYTYRGTDLHDPDMMKYAREGRRRYGRIAIANADSGADAYANASIDEAWRAVNELS